MPLNKNFLGHLLQKYHAVGCACECTCCEACLGCRYPAALTVQLTPNDLANCGGFRHPYGCDLLTGSFNCIFQSCTSIGVPVTAWEAWWTYDQHGASYGMSPSNPAYNAADDWWKNVTIDLQYGNNGHLLVYVHADATWITGTGGIAVCFMRSNYMEDCGAGTKPKNCRNFFSDLSVPNKLTTGGWLPYQDQLLYITEVAPGVWEMHPACAGFADSIITL